MAGSKNNTHYSEGYNLLPTSAAAITLMQMETDATQWINVDGDPEGNEAANPGSIAQDRTNGALYLKVTGTGNTGWQQIPSGADVPESFVTDSGIATPSAGVLNILTQGESETNASGNTVNVFAPRTAKFIVDATQYNGTHQTITAAIAAASSGDTIFIRPGTYTENLTLKAGVSLSAFDCDGIRGDTNGSTTYYPNVKIVGKLSASFTGLVNISGIALQTNSDYAVEITGAVATNLNLFNCFLNGSNNSVINCTTSAGKLNFFNCTGNLETTLIAYLAQTNGTVNFSNCYFRNSGSSVTASTSSGGALGLYSCQFSNPITTSGAVAFSILYSHIAGIGNTIALTLGSSGGQVVEFCRITSGSASAISCGDASTVINCDISSSNTNAITGAGSVSYAGLCFLSSSNINTTTQVVLNEGSSKTVGSANTGVTNTLLVINSSDTASSQALINAQVAGSTAADAYYKAEISGGQSWAFGLDNSASDSFVLAAGGALGTTNTLVMTAAGEQTLPLQPSFLAYLGTTATDVTGAGTAYILGDTDVGVALTEVFDQGGDLVAGSAAGAIYTAPVTGRHFFGAIYRFSGIVISTSSLLSIVTSNRTYAPYRINTVNDAVSGLLILGGNTMADMDAADTAYTSLTCGGEAGDVIDVLNTSSQTVFYGDMLC